MALRNNKPATFFLFRCEALIRSPPSDRGCHCHTLPKACPNTTRCCTKLSSAQTHCQSAIFNRCTQALRNIHWNFECWKENSRRCVAHGTWHLAMESAMQTSVSDGSCNEFFPSLQSSVCVKSITQSYIPSLRKNNPLCHHSEFGVPILEY